MDARRPTDADEARDEAGEQADRREAAYLMNAAAAHEQLRPELRRLAATLTEDADDEEA